MNQYKQGLYEIISIFFKTLKPEIRVKQRRWNALLPSFLCFRGFVQMYRCDFPRMNLLN